MTQRQALLWCHQEMGIKMGELSLISSEAQSRIKAHPPLRRGRGLT